MRAKALWSISALGAAAAMLVLPLVLFALLSYWKLGFMSWSYYVPYEQFGQDVGSADLGKLYRAPLLAVNVTSGHEVAVTGTSTTRPGFGCGDTNHTHSGPPGRPGASLPPGCTKQ